MRRSERFFLWLVIALGVALRFVDLGVPDLFTDETQFILGGVSNGHPAPALWILRGAEMLFGPHILVVRITMAVAGVLCLLPLYGIARRIMSARGALLSVAVASIVPSHIIFSRIAYLDVFLCLGWLLMTFTFLWTTEKVTPTRLFLLYLVFLIASFAKTQAFLLTFLFVIGRIFVLRRKAWKDPVLFLLVLSTIPILLTVATHPAILANIIGNSRNGLFGAAPSRFLALIGMWWSTSWLFLPFLAFSVPFARRFPWPVWMLFSVASLIGFFFGANHPYYATYLIVYALALGVALSLLPRSLSLVVVATLAVITVLFVGPRDLVPRSTLYSWYREPGYWNTHADIINEKLDGASVVTVLGDAGHQVRWYLNPRVLVGKTMDPRDIRGMILLLDNSQRNVFPDATTVYKDNRVEILNRK